MSASCAEASWPCPLRVVVVDDSPSSRTLLSRMLESDPRIRVVGVAEDPYSARALIKSTLPDLLVVDVEMPRMNGVQFLRNIMRLRPMPVVMVSGVREQRDQIRSAAMEVGAAGFVSKPSAALEQSLESYRHEVLAIVLNTARTALRGAATASDDRGRGGEELDATLQDAEKCQHRRQTLMVAIGASTGGPEALRQVLAGLPRGFPTVVVSQHIPARFVPGLVSRLNDASPLEVREATDGAPLMAGVVHVAPGNRHLRVMQHEDRLLCALNAGPEVNNHRPSVDVLFDSVADVAGRHALGVLLTGMGRDGAKGLFNLHQRGALTIAQDAASSMVWGMPREAIRLGGADLVLPLEQIGPAMRICGLPRRFAS